MSSTHKSSASKYLDEKGRTDAERYLTDVQDNKITACKYIHQLADMMLPRFHEEYNGYHFDASLAVRPVHYIETYTVFPEGEKKDQPFILEPFQRSALELAFGFIDESGFRQFRQVLMMIGRKNGKSSLLAALMLYFLTSDGEPGAEVLSIANTEKQAHRIFGHADQMRLKSPKLKNRIRRGTASKIGPGTTALNYDKNGSLLVSIPSNTGSADGYSASAYVYDELAATTDMGAMLNAIEESVAGRRQASGWIISSENYTRHNIWDEKIDHCKGILSGSIKDDTMLPILYTAEGHDPYDPNSWILANPGLDSGIKSRAYMEQRSNAAIQEPRVRSSFLTKDLCIRATSYTSFFTQEECHNPETFEIDPKLDRYACVGFDLSDVGDLTAAACVWRRPGDNRIYEISHAWIPEAQIEINSARDFKQRDGVPYLQWASGNNPWLTIVPGDKIDHHQAIIGFIDELAEKGIYTRFIAYDRWHVDDWLRNNLEMRVGKERCYPVPYNAATLSPTMKEMKIDLKAHRIINPAPGQEWARSNVMSKIDNAGNVYPNKKELKAHNRIDPFMAELYALHAFWGHLEEMNNICNWVPPEGEAEEDAQPS